MEMGPNGSGVGLLQASGMFGDRKSFIPLFSLQLRLRTAGPKFDQHRAVPDAGCLAPFSFTFLAFVFLSLSMTRTFFLLLYYSPFAFYIG